MILDFFPENTLGDGPKNSRIRVNELPGQIFYVHMQLQEHQVKMD